jgi:hypothetical protein
VVNVWNKGVDAEQNVVLISVPSVLGKGLAATRNRTFQFLGGTRPEKYGL